ncbi:transcriptional regulator [Longibacter salinarum]|uniref:Transcriptional regulator n=1 Tax=Longibacter salinarum TaxID=1850348 RepID=A0A2A8D272_9BACT|nr:Rrf2 family transcriptional regulator [Longibacter salinarum]PEN14980.1 transcriptional regulator [Longibacter salinarum]
MLLSKACEYGLRSTLYLASLDEDGYVSIGTISDKLDISFAFLTKIFQQLNEAGLLKSHRGPSGGVAFTKPTDEISLYEIVVAIDGEDLFEECVLGLPGCGHEKPCPIHDRWATERSRLERLFKRNTLDDMASQIKNFDVRLVPTVT